MKRTLLFIACLLVSVTMLAQENLVVGDVQNSGCLSMAREEGEEEPLPAIILTKEGSVLSVQLLNYESNCATKDFNVTSAVGGGNDGAPYSVNIRVVPHLPGGDLPTCLCPYNVSFTVRNVEANSFYLSCWWYEGLVTLEEGKPFVLGDYSLLDNDQYRPFVENGKVWTYFYYNDMTGKYFEVERVVDGDTIIGGLACKRICDKIGGNYLYALREEGKQVYIAYNRQETPSLLYDFSKDKGDMVCGFKVADVDTISIDGARFRRMRLVTKDWNSEDVPNWAAYWIEGVGSECLLESNFRVPGNDYNLKSCQINGRTYTQQELLKEADKPETASVQHPVDMTSRIVNPRFGNDDVTTGWSGTGFNNWNAKENAEIYSKNYNAFQNIEGLPAGIYAVGVKAFYRAGEDLQTALNHYKANDDASHYAKLYTEADERQTEADIRSVFDNQVKEPSGHAGETRLYDEETGRTYYLPRNLDAAEYYMHELNCYDNKVLAMVDGSLTFGVRKNSMVYGDWSVFDDFTLTYYGQGADAYQMYMDDIWEKNMNKTTVDEGTLYTQYYLDEYCKHRYATTKAEVDAALADIQSAYSLLQRNIELWKEWKLAVNRGYALAASPCYADSKQAQLLAQHCGVEAAETEAARSLTNEQLEAKINETDAMTDALYTQNGFVGKMLKEGKQWVYSRHRNSTGYDEYGMPYLTGEVVNRVTFTISGDTLINGRHYVKLYQQEEGHSAVFHSALREEGTAVYSCVGDGEDKRLVEFNPYHFPDVQSFSYSEHFDKIIDVVDNICVNDSMFVRHNYKYIDGSGVLFVGVEGIGYQGNGILGMNFDFKPSDYMSFEACYEDGKCIFTAEDFDAPATKPDINVAYRPFVEDGKVWKVGAVGSGNPVLWVEYFYFDGDIVVDGKTCKRMMRQRYVSPNYEFYNNKLVQDPSYVGAWYEEDKKVYTYDDRNKQFRLMYDFSLNANDTFQMDGLTYVIGPKQTGVLSGFKGVYRKVVLRDGENNIYSPAWLEGVGSTDCPTTSVYPGYVDPMWFLMSCTVGDEVIYLNDGYEDGATPEVMGVRNRFDFTHTIKTKPKAPRMEGATQSLYGEYNSLQLGINLDPLDDVYFVRIADQTGKAVYEKTVNAGSIVGLNIDISAYAAGRYTVTMENSSETFTGTFDVQTTGISLTPALSRREGAIYNLQGQRISSLQKGLNIVNGRKVLVK